MPASRPRAGRRLALPALIAAALLAPAAASAAPGDVDPDFGTGGVTLVDRPATSEAAPVALFPRANGTSTLVTRFATTSGFRVSVNGVGANGGGDASYGPLELDGAPVVHAAAGPAGSIVIAHGGSTARGGGGPAALLRVTGRAQADTAFGTAGRVNLPAGDRLLAVAVDASERPLVVRASGDTVAVVRYETDGDVDPTFGDGGARVLPGVAADTVQTASHAALAVAADGAVLAALAPDGERGIVVAKLTGDGALESGFATGGVATLTQAGATLGGVVPRAGGGVAVGAVWQGAAAGTTDLGVVQLTAAGVPDTAFGGGDGAVTATTMARGQVGGFAAHGDGLVLAGTRSTNPGTVLGVVRITAAGAVDTGFGPNGFQDFFGWTTPGPVAVPTTSGVLAAMPNPDATGTLVRIRKTNNGGFTYNVRFGSTVRMSLTDGANPASGGYVLGSAGRVFSFGTAGHLWTAFGTDGVGYLDAGSLATESESGRIVTTAWNPYAGGTIARRWVGAGWGDLEYGTNGTTLIAAERLADEDLVVDAADRAVLAGLTTTGSLLVARLTVTGALDTSFAEDGTLLTAPPAGVTRVAAVAADDEGRTTALLTGPGKAVLVRVTSAGALDPAFGTGGVVDLGTGTFGQVVAEGDGVLVAADAAPAGLQVRRYTAAGALDPAFGDDGIAPVSASPAPVDGPILARQPDGRIVAAGTAADGRLLVGRLLGEGTRDATWNGGEPVVRDFGAAGLSFAGEVLPEMLRVTIAGRYETEGASRLAMVRLDAEPVTPQLTVRTPRPGVLVTAADARVKGTTSRQSDFENAVTVDVWPGADTSGTPVWSGGGPLGIYGSFDVALPADLADGTYAVRVRQAKTDGSVAGETTVELRLDRAAPVLAMTAPAAGAEVVPGAVTVRGTLAETPADEGRPLTVSAVRADGGTAPEPVAATVSGGTWEATLPGLTAGAYTITASLTDAADRTGTASSGLTVVAPAPGGGEGPGTGGGNGGGGNPGGGDGGNPGTGGGNPNPGGGNPGTGGGNPNPGGGNPGASGGGNPGNAGGGTRPGGTSGAATSSSATPDAIARRALGTGARRLGLRLGSTVSVHAARGASGATLRRAGLGSAPLLAVVCADGCASVKAEIRLVVGGRTYRLATKTRRVPAGGAMRIQPKLDAELRKALRRARTARLAVTFTVTPATGERVTATRSWRLR